MARSLESRWEARLAELAEAEAALATQASTRPQLPRPEDLAATVADLPALWAAPTTSDKDRKRLLRTLLGDVTITPSTQDSTRLDVVLRWKSGATQQIQVTRRRIAVQLRNTDPAAIALARRVGPSPDNAGLAAALNAAGHVLRAKNTRRITARPDRTQPQTRTAMTITDPSLSTSVLIAASVACRK